jgi:hypothetical protein
MNGILLFIQDPSMLEILQNYSDNPSNHCQLTTSELLLLEYVLTEVARAQPTLPTTSMSARNAKIFSGSFD